MTFELGGMTFQPQTIPDPCSGESVTYVHRVDVQPQSLVAIASSTGLYIQREHRYLDPDVLGRELGITQEAA
jgi:hypothetical protein